MHDLAAHWDGDTILIIAHAANTWALDHLVPGIPLENLVDAPFAWQAGWRYALPAGRQEDRERCSTAIDQLRAMQAAMSSPHEPSQPQSTIA
ncbi:MAG: hypothetical protein ACJ789_16995 [Thermomicrobiales bacterium]